jgi:acyl-CoA synthetase (AMP-forming)/AMP-acid ligase II
MSSFTPRSLIDVLCMRAAIQADDRAYTFLVNGETERDSLSYYELDLRCRQIAAMLQQSLRRGDRVYLMYPPSLEFIAAFLGCLYAGMIAVPAYPPHPTRPERELPRLRAMAREAGFSAILGTNDVLLKLSALFRDDPDLARVPRFATDHDGLADANAWQQPAVQPDTVAFLQYTSGSTAVPRGVMVSHGNLLHNLAYLHDRARVDGRPTCVSWLPPFHDMGLFAGFLHPLFEGIPSYLMAPLSFLQKPIRWLQAISRYRGTNSGGPNFAYDLCVQRTTFEQRCQLDLSCWQIAFNGAEPIRRTTLERFWITFRDCGFSWNAFRPVYGLAEATVLVTSGQLPISGPGGPPANHTSKSCQTGLGAQPHHNSLIRECPARIVSNACGKNGSPTHLSTSRSHAGLVSCGAPRFSTRVVIADAQHLNRVGPGEVGEIWISSPSVARGYWNRSDETDRTFRAYLSDSGEGPFLRTGDLGFMLHGELFVTGRIKDLIVIRGRKHYPHDIELTVESSHPLIRRHCSAAVAVPTDEGERLVIVAEVDRRRTACDSETSDRRPEVQPNPELDDVFGTIRQAVAEQHELQTYGICLVPPGGIPKTSSGKIQRQACRTSVLTGTLKSFALWPLRAQPLGAGIPTNCTSGFGLTTP